MSKWQKWASIHSLTVKILIEQLMYFLLMCPSLSCQYLKEKWRPQQAERLEVQCRNCFGLIGLFLNAVRPSNEKLPSCDTKPSVDLTSTSGCTSRPSWAGFMVSRVTVATGHRRPVTRTVLDTHWPLPLPVDQSQDATDSLALRSTNQAFLVSQGRFSRDWIMLEPPCPLSHLCPACKLWPCGE